jgi:outer membrane protein OmpA-like peptidoglycan-associated protein
LSIAHHSVYANAMASRATCFGTLWIGGAVSLLCIATSSPAMAQSTVNGWALDRYQPTGAGEPFFVSDFPWYSVTHRAAAAVTVDYARNPLIVRPANSPALAIIDNMLQLHMQGSLSLFNRIGLSVDVPVSLVQTAGAQSGAAGLSAYTTGPVTGDVRLGLRTRIFGQSDLEWFSVHFLGQIYLGMLPYSGDEHWVTDETLRARAQLTFAGRVSALRYTLSVGYHFRRPVTFARTIIDNEFYLRAGVAMVALAERFHVGPEVSVDVTPASFGLANVDPTVNAEAVLGMSYTFLDALQVGFAAGPGLSPGVGTPSLRGLFRVSYAPFARGAELVAPPDSDGDALIDSEDVCPNEPAGPRPDPLRRGCPAPPSDSDNDGVVDSVDLCPEERQTTARDPGRPGCNLADQDQDGVADAIDQCPDRPEGDRPDRDRAGCPADDTDGDGVFSPDDQCPTVSAGALADPERMGCPAPDTDHDSVQDPADRCPNEAGVPNGRDPTRNGCPGLVSFTGNSLTISQPILFATDRDIILPRSAAVLQELADALQNIRAIERLSVQAHTDEDDTPRNRNLSLLRAQSVRAWLIAHGVDGTRLEAVGFGNTRPLVPMTALRGAALRAARERNRRVEFVVLSPSSVQPSAAVPAAPVGPSAAPPATSTPVILE